MCNRVLAIDNIWQLHPSHTPPVRSGAPRPTWAHLAASVSFEDPYDKMPGGQRGEGGELGHRRRGSTSPARCLEDGFAAFDSIPLAVTPAAFSSEFQYRGHNGSAFIAFKQAP